MKRVFLAWLFSLLIGSFLLGLLSVLITSNKIGESILVVFFAFFLSLLSALPLLITELVSAEIQQNKEKSFKKYELAKYIVASITLLIIFFGTFIQTNEDDVFRFGSFIISFCYGIPGYILHIKYIKPALFKDKHSSNNNNEDLLDS